MKRSRRRNPIKSSHSNQACESSVIYPSQPAASKEETCQIDRPALCQWWQRATTKGHRVSRTI